MSECGRRGEENKGEGEKDAKREFSKHPKVPK